MVVCLAMCACYEMSVFAATRGAKEQPVGAGMVREFPAPVGKVRQALQGVVGDHIIHGTRVFDKSPILMGAEAVSTTPLFAAWDGPGEAARLESPAAASTKGLGGTEGKDSEDLYRAAGVAKSKGVGAGSAVELFAGAISEGIEGGGRSESGTEGNRGDFRFSGRQDHGSDVGRDPENGEGRGFAGSVLDAELSASGGGVSGGASARRRP